MFLWPLAYRFGIAPFTRPELQWPGFTSEFTTSDFFNVEYTSAFERLSAPFAITPGLDAVWGYEPSVDAMEGLLHLFAHEAPAVRELRNRGLGLVNRLPPLKRLLASMANAS